MFNTSFSGHHKMWGAH